MSKRKILQIMAAPGWGAIFGGDTDGEEFIESLVGWALVREGENESVVGLVASEQVEFCDADPDFKGYVHLQDMLMNAMDAVDELDEEGFDDEDFDAEDDEPPDVPPPFRRKGGRLN